MTQERIYQEMGNTIRTRRKKLKLTQHGLAGRLSLSRAALANIEIGRQAVYVHHLFELAAALGLKPHELLPLPDTTAATAAAAEIPLPDDLKPQQRNQIAQLLAEVDLGRTPKAGGNA